MAQRVTHRSPDSRLGFIDWTRGLAAVVMLQGHVFHSFTAKESRDGATYVMSQFVGGVAPATFLLLTGITLAFLMESQERKGQPLGRRWIAALRRSGYLFLLAFLFRTQLWLFGQPQSNWHDLLRVDILNCMGFAMLLLSPLALISTPARARFGALAGLVIAFAAPLVTSADWSAFPAFLRAYWVPDYNYFSFFPWAAFIAFGISAGCVVRLVAPDYRERLMQWAAILGFAILLGAQFCSNLPYAMYPKSDFWLDSPWLVLMKLSGILIVMAVSFLWNQVRTPGWSWIQQFGTTSLLVYWVHIELVYGRWFGAWKESLPVPQVIAAAASVIVFMLGLSVLRTNWRRLRPRLPSFSWTPAPPDRVPGD